MDQYGDQQHDDHFSGIFYTLRIDMCADHCLVELSVRFSRRFELAAMTERVFQVECKCTTRAERVRNCMKLAI